MREYAADSVTIDVIGIVRSCFSEKFGIPRQPGLASSAVANLEISAPYCRPEMIRGLEGFSHLWVHFLFHQAVHEGWKATVRPPRLDGRNRRGVFATRSPHRPNHIGLSVVRLLGLVTTGGTVTLELGGVDLLDGTPVIDIKPYVSYCDSIPGATTGWLQEEPPGVKVEFHPETKAFCAEYEKKTGRKLYALIRELLQLDPRPANQRGRKNEFGMLLWDVNVRWVVGEDVCMVTACKSP